MRHSPTLAPKAATLRVGNRRRCLLFAALVGLQGCATTHTFPLVTDPTVISIELCANGAALPPVSGRLAGDSNAAPDYVWLVGDGRRQFITWPAGFTVTFGPAPVVRNERGDVVARDGEVLILPQTSPAGHSGTTADRYLATGMVGGRCYYKVARLRRVCYEASCRYPSSCVRRVLGECDITARDTGPDFLNANAQRFRESMGLSTDPALLATMSMTITSQQKYGVPLTRAEEADIDARITLQESLLPLVDFANAHDDVMGGVWLDQTATHGHGAMINVALTDRADQRLVAQAAALIPAGVAVAYPKVNRSLGEL